MHFDSGSVNVKFRHGGGTSSSSSPSSFSASGWGGGGQGVQRGETQRCHHPTSARWKTFGGIRTNQRASRTRASTESLANQRDSKREFFFGLFVFCFYQCFCTRWIVIVNGKWSKFSIHILLLSLSREACKWARKRKGAKEWDEFLASDVMRVRPSATRVVVVVVVLFFVSVNWVRGAFSSNERWKSKIKQN